MKFQYRAEDDVPHKWTWPERMVLPIAWPIYKMVQLRDLLKHRNEDHCHYCDELIIEGEPFIDIKLEYVSRWRPPFRKSDVRRYCLVCGAEFTKMAANNLVEPEDKDRALDFAKKAEDKFWKG